MIKGMQAGMAAGLLLLQIGTASANVITLDFEGIEDYPGPSTTEILDFYNGGTASNGASGTNFGVQFSNGATALCLNTEAAPGCSNTSKGGLGVSTSRLSAMFFPELNPVMNVAAGFDTGFAFAFANPFATSLAEQTSVNIFDGLDGLGTLLASAILPETSNGFSEDGCFLSAYCPFSDFALTFTGVARSVTFGGSVNLQVFDDITFGSAQVGDTGGNDNGGGSATVPVPAPIGLLGASLVGLVWSRRPGKMQADRSKEFMTA